MKTFYNNLHCVVLFIILMFIHTCSTVTLSNEEAIYNLQYQSYSTKCTLNSGIRI